jgi:hypothetical protein
VLEKQCQEIRSLRDRPIRLPSDLPVPGHSYGPKLICLCLDLAKRLGFRAANAALTIVFKFLRIQDKVPSWDSIRCWACRVGISILEDQEQSTEDEIWMSDHSNQIGQEKILTICRLRVSDLPPPGKTLSRSKLKVIAVVAGKSWTREDVRREYDKLAAQRGAPRWLLTDGAVELHETVDALEKHAKNGVRTIRDMKHKAANLLESLIGKDDRFAKYTARVGRTRSHIQQTELGHFTPPPQKTKARFMNMGPMLWWGQMVSHHLSHPHSKSRDGITADRMNAKLGWVRDFRDDLARWSECEAVMQHCLNYLERHAVEVGTVAELSRSLQESFPDLKSGHEQSRHMRDRLLWSILEIESQLTKGERVWALTDNLESAFGGFKRLERQHSKSGFTGLIAALPIVLEDLTAERVKVGLQRVPVKKMKEWIKGNLGSTLTAKRQLAYREYSPRPTGPVKNEIN